MKAVVALLLSSIAISLFSSCATGPQTMLESQGRSAPAAASIEAAHTQWHSLALYLVTGNENGTISELTLSERPLISEADIIAYNWTNHAMKVTPETQDRLPEPGASGTPFVVVADGVRVYVGLFWTMLSSFTPQRPYIVVLPGHSQHPVTWYIKPGWFRPLDPDPRSDLRIKQTLMALGKLQ
jgi:hypothetical protein